MRTLQNRAWLGALMVCALAGPAGGAEFTLNIKADGIALGDHVMGPKLTSDDLKGKVILIEFWGIR